MNPLDKKIEEIMKNRHEYLEALAQLFIVKHGIDPRVDEVELVEQTSKDGRQISWYYRRRVAP